MERFIKNIEFGKVLNLKNLIDHVEGGIESRTLAQRKDFSTTLFAFDKGEGVSAYSMPGDTMIYVFEGKIQVGIEKNAFKILEGDTIVVPFGTLHSMDAMEKSKVMIVIVKPQKE